jgi:hypothetical protein
MTSMFEVSDPSESRGTNGQGTTQAAPVRMGKGIIAEAYDEWTREVRPAVVAAKSTNEAGQPGLLRVRDHLLED